MVAKKKSGPAKFVKVIAERAKKNPAVKEAKSDVMQVVVPAVVAFGASQLIRSLASSLLAKRTSALALALAPHVGPLVSLAILAGAWFGTRHSKTLVRYRAGVLAGAGVATLLTLINAYLVKQNVLPDTLRFQMPEPQPPELDLLQVRAEPKAPAVQATVSRQTAVADNDDLADFQTGVFAQDDD